MVHHSLQSWGGLGAQSVGGEEFWWGKLSPIGSLLFPFEKRKEVIKIKGVSPLTGQAEHVLSFHDAFVYGV